MNVDYVACPGAKPWKRPAVAHTLTTCRECGTENPALASLHAMGATWPMAGKPTVDCDVCDRNTAPSESEGDASQILPLPDFEGRVTRALEDLARVVGTWESSALAWARTVVDDSVTGDAVIAHCRSRGYAADYHWHGRPGSFHIQVARSEGGLSFPHGHTGAWRPAPAKGSAR